MFSLKQDDEDDTFRVKRTIGSSYNADEDDVRKTKSALAATGDYKPPKWGMTGVTDDGMFDGLRKFQKREGLQVDGIMRPGGPTEKKLRERTGAAKSVSIAAEKSQAQPKTDIFGNPLPHTKAQTQTTETPDKRPSLDNLDIDLGLLKRTGQERDRSKETQVAIAPYLFQLLAQTANRVGPAIARSLPPALGLADKAARDAAKRGQGGNFENPPATPPIPEEWQEPDAPAQRQQADPPPPTPGFEPSDFEMPNRTEYPSEPVELPDLAGPLPEVEQPTIFVLPIPDPKEFGDGILEMKGNEATRKELERVRDYFLSLGWKHIAGGRYAADDPEVLEGKVKVGDERTEQHIPGPGKAFEADTRPGGRFADLTFRDKRNRIVHIQTVDVDRNGKPTQRELDNAESIRRAEKDTDVLLIPKGAQLDRIRRF